MLFKVFLDTNIFKASGYSFRNNRFNKMREYAKDGIINIIVNSVVIGEVKRHIKEEIGERISEINRITKKSELAGLRNSDEFGERFSKIDDRKYVDYVVAEFDKLIKELNVEMLDVDNISVEELLGMYFEKEYPFEKIKAKKDEFPDAIAFLNIRNEILRSDYDENMIIYCIVSNDNGFRNSFSNLVDSRKDVELYENLEELLEMLLRYTKKEEFKDYIFKYSYIFEHKIINKVNETIMFSNYIIEDIDGTSEEAEVVEIKDYAYVSYFYDIEKDEEKYIFKMSFDVIDKVIIDYSFYNVTESYFDKETRDYLWETYTSKRALFKVVKKFDVEVCVVENVVESSWDIKDVNIIDLDDNIYLTGDDILEEMFIENKEYNC